MTTLACALITQNCPAGKISDNLAHTLDLVGQAADYGADIAVFPEMNLTGYVAGNSIKDIGQKPDNAILKPLRDLSKKLHIHIVTGLAEKTDEGQIFATQLLITPDGQIGKYRKIHIAPFEQGYFSPGNQIPVFQINQFRFGIQLCYDAHFPELSASMALKGVDVIFICHASPRGTRQEKYHSWLRHLTARAFDNGVYIAACNQSGDNGKGLVFPGISLLIGPDGHVISHHKEGRKKIHLVKMKKAMLDQIRAHKMKYFLPNRRNDLFRLE